MISWNTYKKLGTILAVSALAVFVWGVQGRTLRGIVPASPELLFAALPVEIDGWKLTKSKGWMGDGTWLESSVIRDFEEIPKKKKKDNKPGKTRLMIQDTGKFKGGGDLDMFADFKPVKYSRCEYKLLGGYPAIVMQAKSGKTTAQFLVRERWILTVSLENQEGDALKNWFQQVNFKALTKIKDGPFIDKPDRIVSVSIDELEGKSSRLVSLRGETESEMTEGDLMEIEEEKEGGSKKGRRDKNKKE